jgi:hypothetical protein
MDIWVCVDGPTAEARAPVSVNRNSGDCRGSALLGLGINHSHTPFVFNLIDPVLSKMSDRHTDNIKEVLL